MPVTGWNLVCHPSLMAGPETFGLRFVLCDPRSTGVPGLHVRTIDRNGARTARTIVAGDLYKSIVILYNSSHGNDGSQRSSGTTL